SRPEPGSRDGRRQPETGRARARRRPGARGGGDALPSASLAVRLQSTSEPNRRLIRFRLPPEGEECLAFTYSPLLEAVLSLHVLVEPKHHPLQHEWVRRMRTLPADLRRRIRQLAFVYDRVVPEFLMPSADAGSASFEEELGVL